MGSVQENQGPFSFSRPCGRCGGAGQFIEQPCRQCGGTGAVRRPQQVKVRIPRGVKDGGRIRVKGRGGAGTNGGPDGDLYVQVHVRPHPVFGRDGDHLTLNVPVSYPELVLGAEVELPTLDGDTVTIRLPAGTRSGRTFRVRGKGVTSAKGTGDLLATVELVVPTDLDAPTRAAVDALAAAATESPRERLRETVERTAAAHRPPDGEGTDDA
jgi:molecular chaperone DnaJ